MSPLTRALLTAVALSAVAAADDVYYGMSAEGRLAVNGTPLDKLPGGFDADDPGDSQPEQAWRDLAVVGADRYALRADGIVRKNGGKHLNLPWTPGDPVYVAMAVDAGVVYALRADGLVMRDKKVFVDLPTDGFPFVDIEIAPDGTVYSMAVDGAVFANDDDELVVLDMRGDPLVPGPLGEEDAASPFTAWTDLEVSDAGALYALRADGIVTRAAAPAGVETEIASLWALFPGPTAQLPLAGLTYSDLELQAGVIATPVALRRDGQIRTAPLLLEDTVLQVDHAGDALVDDEVFVDLEIRDDDGLEAWALRADGRLYGDFVANTPLLVFPQKGYTHAAVSDVGPDLSNFKNNKPVIGRYKAQVLEGRPASIPVVVSDTDKPADEIGVTLDDDPADLPPGVTWDDEELRLVLDDSLTKGSAKLRIAVDDGENKAKKVKLSVKIKPVDAKLDKNKPPKLIKVTPLQALVGIPFELELMAFDPDGDDVTFEASTSGKANVFTLPVTDAAISVEEGRTIFRWTPQFEDLGKQLIRVEISDGQKTKKGALKLNVVSPLIF